MSKLKTIQQMITARWGPLADLERHKGIYRIVVGTRRVVLGEGKTPEAALRAALDA